MTKGRKNSRVYAKIFEEWNKNRTPLTLNGEDFTYIPEPGEEFRQCYLADTKKNRQQRFYKARHGLDYLQPNMRRLYAGTETPEDILALSEAADRAGIGNEVYVIMPGRSVRQGDIVTGEAITRDANRLAYEWMRPGIIVANRIH